MNNTFDPTEAYKVVEDMVSKSQVAFQSAMSAGTENAQKGLEKFANTFQEQAGKTQEVFSKGYEDFASLNKSNIDAVVQCGTVMAKSAETFGQAAAEVAQKNVEASIAHAKALAGAKDINDVINLNTTYARDAVDTIVAEGTKLSDIGVKLAQEAFGPLQAQFTATVEKATEAATEVATKATKKAA